MVWSIQTEYGLDTVQVARRPLRETLVHRRKYIHTELHCDWGYGKSRLFNPPLHILPIVVRNIEAIRVKGVVLISMCPSKAWFMR